EKVGRQPYWSRRWDTTPGITGILTYSRGTGVGTMAGGQFDWGGRLLKGNGGAQKVTSARTGIARESAKAEGSLTARETSRAGTKVGLSDPAAVSGNAVAQRIKATPGITG
ncbi:hypothetical protein TheetDRAFT_2886, partial [Thermoanaerobacter ethanolicus JW 200]